MSIIELGYERRDGQDEREEWLSSNTYLYLGSNGTFAW